MTAQSQDAPSLWELLKPEYLVQRVLQGGIMALRTQIDIKYGDMTVDLRLGQVTLSDVSVWPLSEWDVDAECRIEVDRLTIRAAPLDRPDLVRFKAQAIGVSAPVICLPPDQRQVAAMAGLDSFAVPRVTLDMEYDIAQAEADVHAYTQIDGLVALDLTAHFTYLWFDARDQTEDPIPVIYLSRAALTLENLGGFEMVKGMLPPTMTDPAQSPLMIRGMLGGAIAGLNRDAAPEGATGDPGALNEAQTDFVESVVTVWPAFLQNPARLVLETGFSPDDDRFLEIPRYEDDPGLGFSELQPVLSLSPAPARTALPAALVSQAVGDAADGMDPDDRRRVGVALATGLGAPRNVSLGTEILARLAETGDGEAALALSAALEQRDPSAAYRWALVAGGASRTGAAARLDRLERVLPFAEVLELQATALGDVQHPLEALEKVALMRDEAMGRLSGVGRVRSYSVAALWALMGAAAGDSESLDILAQIDEKARLSDAAGRAAWAEAEQAAADLAMQAWLGQDLPARFGSQ